MKGERAMFGFLIGGASLAGLLYMLRGHHRGHYRHAYAGWPCGDDGGWGEGRAACGGGPPWARGHRHHGPPWARGGFHARRRFFLRRMFERLDTTPGQEKVIVRAVERVAEAGGTLRGELRDSLGDLAGAVRADAFDESTLAATFAEHDAALSRFRRVAVEALSEVHEALDERQRARVADFIESRRRRWGGPYRAAPEQGKDA
jgi:Heavy-metal resistance